MDFQPIFQWAEDTAIGAWVRGSTWPFPLIETFHILALAVFMGALFLIDLRLLGFRIGGISAAAMNRQMNSYINWGIVVILVSGFLLFASEGGKLYDNDAFTPKMILLALALIFHYTGHRIAVSTEQPPSWGWAAGALSLCLWFLTGAAGRAIGFV
jgi:uncharacterized membrane protein